MKYTLTNPITAGDIGNRIAIDAVQLASIAINFDPLYSNNGRYRLV